MAWYVFALVDRPPRSPGRGFTAALTAHAIAGIFVVAERRADVPPLEFDALQRHERVVERLAARVPAILPVRFGTLVTLDDLQEALGERGEEFREALARVRGCVQMTWRLAGSPSKESKKSRDASKETPAELTASSGTEYLRRRAAAEHATMPAAMRPLRKAFAPLISTASFQPASATFPASLYHLVPKRALAEYRDVASRLQRAAPRRRLTLSGPWPPYAFTPEVL
jgi:hypothetical protein